MKGLIKSEVLIEKLKSDLDILLRSFKRGLYEILLESDQKEKKARRLRKVKKSPLKRVRGTSDPGKSHHDLKKVSARKPLNLRKVPWP